MTITRAQFFREWADALDSGDYPQGFGALARADDAETSPSSPSEFCCLGVGCEVAVKHGLLTRSRSATWFFSYQSPGATVGSVSELPPTLAEFLGFMGWSGVPVTNPPLPEHPLSPTFAEDMEDRLSFAEANDEGRLTFPEMAQIIRDTYVNGEG